MKVLYIEDEPDIQIVAKIAMESVGGFEVHEFSSGPAAIAAAKDGLIADVIVVDMMMPEMNGQETLQVLRTIPAFAKTPAIFMTAKVQAAEVQSYMDAGAAGCIPKPFDPTTLAEQIAAIFKSVG